MNYFISNINGQLDRFMKMLEDIDFSENDNLFILGCISGFGGDGIEIIQDIMMRNNVFAIMGKPEFELLRFMKNLEKKNNGEMISAEAGKSMMKWLSEGGMDVAQKIQTLDDDDREAISDYLEDMDVYLEITIDDKDYLLTYSGIHGFEEGREIDDYELEDFIKADEKDAAIKPEGVILVTGCVIEGRDGIYVNPSNISLSCISRLGVYCVETGESIYA